MHQIIVAYYFLLFSRYRVFFPALESIVGLPVKQVLLIQKVVSSSFDTERGFQSSMLEYYRKLKWLFGKLKLGLFGICMGQACLESVWGRLVWKVLNRLVWNLHWTDRQTDRQSDL